MKGLQLIVCVLLLFLFACQRKAVPSTSLLPIGVIPAPAALGIKDTVTKPEKPIPIPLRDDRFYLDAFSELERMLSNKTSANFKRAVFITV